MTNQLKNKVEGYLRAIGCTPVKINDPRARWHYEIDYPPNTPHRIHVLNPVDREQAVVIASATAISPEHLAAFEELDDDAKAEFIWDLQMSLNNQFAEFSLQGAASERSCPKLFEVTCVRYEDGLNLDSFARSVSSVYKLEISGILCVQKHLGQKNFGSGGRFDFRRLGL